MNDVLAHNSGRCFPDNCYLWSEETARDLQQEGWYSVSGPTECRTHPGRWIVFAAEKAWDNSVFALPRSDPRRSRH